MATNEDAPHFFDPLKDVYVISSIADYRNLWVEGSGWWNESSQLFPKNDSAPFDGMMEVSACVEGEGKEGVVFLISVLTIIKCGLADSIVYPLLLPPVVVATSNTSFFTELPSFAK